MRGAKRLRGVRRRLRRVVAMPSSIGSSFPKPEGSLGYLDFKLPVGEVVVDGPESSIRIRRICMEALLRTAERLRSVRDKASGSRVVTMIQLPAIFNSRVTIFFDEEYFESFFIRPGPEELWSPLPKERSIVREWCLDQMSSTKERGYKFVYDDDDGIETGELWFLGDL